MKIKRLAPEWYRLDVQGSPYYADLQKVNDLFWQASIRAKNTHAEVTHTRAFRWLTDVREAAERSVADLAHSEGRPGD